VQNAKENIFFELPKNLLPAIKKTSKNGEPYIDYTKSIGMMQDEYLNSLEQIAE